MLTPVRRSLVHASPCASRMSLLTFGKPPKLAHDVLSPDSFATVLFLIFGLSACSIFNKRKPGVRVFLVTVVVTHRVVCERGLWRINSPHCFGMPPCTG